MKSAIMELLNSGGGIMEHKKTFFLSKGKLSMVLCMWKDLFLQKN